MKLNNIVNCIVGLSISIVAYTGLIFANNDQLTDQQKLQAYHLYHRLSVFTQGKDMTIRDNLIQSLQTIAITFTDEEKKIIDYFFEIRQYVEDIKKNKNLKEEIGLYRQQRSGQYERQSFASIQRCVPYMDLMTYFAKKYPASFLLALWRIESSCSLSLPSNEKGYFQINSKTYSVGTGTLLDLSHQVKDVQHFIDQKFDWYNTVNQSSGYRYDFDHYVVTGNLMHTFGALYNALSGTIYTDIPQPRNLHYLYGSGNRIGLQQHYRDIIDRQYSNRFLVD